MGQRGADVGDTRGPIRPGRSVRQRGEVGGGSGRGRRAVKRHSRTGTVVNNGLDVGRHDPVSRAFLTNDVRVALVTLRVLEEEASCSFDGPGDGANGGERMPRPSIPGT